MQFFYAAVPVCDGEYNFTLSVVNSSKLILQSRLCLYLNLIQIPLELLTSYIIEIRTKSSNGVLSNLSIMEEIYPMKDGYMEFHSTVGHGNADALSRRRR